MFVIGSQTAGPIRSGMILGTLDRGNVLVQAITGVNAEGMRMEVAPRGTEVEMFTVYANCLCTIPKTAEKLIKNN